MIIALLKSLEELPFIGWSEDHRTHFATLLNLAETVSTGEELPVFAAQHTMAAERAEAADRFVLTLVFWENLSFCRAPNVAQQTLTVLPPLIFKIYIFCFLFLESKALPVFPFWNRKTIEHSLSQDETGTINLVLRINRKGSASD